MDNNNNAGLKVIFGLAVGIPTLLAMTEVIIPALLTTGCKIANVNNGVGCGTEGLLTGNGRGLLAPLHRSDAFNRVPRGLN